MTDVLLKTILAFARDSESSEESMYVFYYDLDIITKTLCEKPYFYYRWMQEQITIHILSEHSHYEVLPLLSYPAELLFIYWMIVLLCWGESMSSQKESVEHLADHTTTSSNFFNRFRLIVQWFRHLWTSCNTTKDAIICPRVQSIHLGDVMWPTRARPTAMSAMASWSFL